MKWYLWEKEPGRIGILWYSQLERHKDTYICDFEGTIEQAIAYAKDLEEGGYETCRLTTAGDKEKEISAETCEEGEYQQISFFAIRSENASEDTESTLTKEAGILLKKRTKRQKRANKAVSEAFENYEAEGQLSLYDLFPEQKQPVGEESSSL